MSDDIVAEQRTVIKFYVKLGKTKFKKLTKIWTKFMETLRCPKQQFVSGFIALVKAETPLKTTLEADAMLGLKLRKWTLR